MTEHCQITRLDNGLTIITEKLDRVETVSFGAYVASGTRHEEAEENGVAHFLEHMAFKGTKRRSAAEIAEQIEDVGGHINAYTAREQTAYYVKLLKDDLALGVDMIGDILTHSTFLDHEFERERGVILQEIGQANDTPDDIIFDQFQETAFTDQPMGRPTLGTEKLIRNVRRETLLAFMQRNYTTHNTVIAAAGAVSHQDVVAMVETSFADLPTHKAPSWAPATYAGGEIVTHRELDQTHIVLGYKAISYLDDDYHAVMLLSTLLGGGMSSRLFQEIREKRGLVYSVYSFVQPFMDTGLFGIYAGTAAEDVATLLPVIEMELQKLENGFTDAELRRGKAQLKSSLLMSLENTGSRCEQIARQMQIFGHTIPTSETIAKIDRVSGDDILHAARKIFSTPPTRASVGPIKELPPLRHAAICPVA
ncbi:insulinase family protein [Candidatus Kirkpatrickella diaphorinae]|uniref:Insulinase family protein n=1 Tax=Candidatus Kirkpatrickella diaphorinae TaxID=2984322 RepID=A0ABY6GLE7_9PROT|nr:pitrilysin family protein [Candidatus Kirkpatrickella diaphorinae]UYH52152.1 insulinase family protein [Candidatus Kirkpatrickella diaphorinae]